MLKTQSYNILPNFKALWQILGDNMSKIKIITDSNSGMLQQEGKDLDVFVIPMPFTINGEEYLEEITISQDQFYEFLASNADVTTSQPSRYYLQELWDEFLKEYDEIVYIPMSSGLSGTCSNATALSNEYNGKVQVVDNKRISVTQKMSVLEAVSLAKAGKSAQEIKEYLESEKNNTAIYICMGTLKYLKKGGRITATAAALGSLLRIKPVLSSDGGNFEKFAITLNFGQAKKKMLSQVKADLETKFKDLYEAGNMAVAVAHTQNEQEALKFKDEILKEFPNLEFKWVSPLSLSVSCHIGPGALAVAIFSNTAK